MILTVFLLAPTVPSEPSPKNTARTVEAGSMTKDLALLVGDQQSWLTTEGFLDKVSENLDKAMG